MSETIICKNPKDTFALGERLGGNIVPGDVILLHGGLGAGKTLLTKGILHSLNFDQDEVTSPSFSLVNLYKTPGLNVYHIDLWRIDESADAAFAVGLDEMLDELNSVIIIEWPERLGNFVFESEVKRIFIIGEGDQFREITIT